MAKTKKNKKGLSEVVTKKKSGIVKLNPFDVRTIRPKQKILGRKTKNDVGKPGVARAKAILKRKETLLQEYKIKNKSNMFMDKRIGEKDASLSAEDKMIARYTAERMKSSGKQSIFNLGDDFDLTHGGSSIRDIDKFENPQSDDDAEEEERLNAKFVGEAHFGGFMSRADEEFKEGRGNSRKEWIENLIKESKKRKAEKRKLEEETEERTKELDENWKQLLGNIRGSGLVRHSKAAEEVEENKIEYDPYDMLVRQMTYERKEARGSERLKTEEEKLKEEKEKLERLEEDRLRRMRGEAEGTATRGAAVSVEDMQDPQVKKKNKMTKKEKRQLLKSLLRGEKECEEGEEEQESEEEEEEEQDEEEDEEENGEEEASGDEEDSDEEEDQYSDLNDSDQEEEEEVKEAKQHENEKDRHDAAVRKMIEMASRELPYVFSIPETYEELTGHLSGRSVGDQKLVLERILKCNHPSLGEGNKEKLMAFYVLLLQYIQDCGSSYDPQEKSSENSLEKIGLQVVEALIPILFQLTSVFQAHAAKAIQEVLREKFEGFDNLRRKTFPGLDTILFIKIVLLLFPASDYRHPVVTPCLVFLSSILAQTRPVDRPSLASGLILAIILTEAVQLSKRFSPELVNFLLGIFHLAVQNPDPRPVPPCKGGGLLVLTGVKTIPCGASVRLSLSEVVSVEDVTEEFRLSCLITAARLINRLLSLYRDLPAATEVWRPFLPLLASIEQQGFLPSQLVTELAAIKESIASMPHKTGAIVKPAKQVQMLRMLEPKIEEDFRPFEKKRTGDRALLEEQKLRHKMKQEKKGAKKEIRKDMAFLASVKAREAREKDADRRQKTKSLFSGLASQEGEYKQLLRKKKKS